MVQSPEQAVGLVTVHVGVGVEAGHHHDGRVLVPGLVLVRQAPPLLQLQLVHTESVDVEAPTHLATAQAP